MKLGVYNINHRHFGLFKGYAKKYGHLNNNNNYVCKCGRSVLDYKGMNKFSLGNKIFWGGVFKCHVCRIVFVLKARCNLKKHEGN